MGHSVPSHTGVGSQGFLSLLAPFVPYFWPECDQYLVVMSAQGRVKQWPSRWRGAGGLGSDEI